MRTDLTDITLVVDRSGSMQAIREDAEGGVNAFIQDQAKEAGEVGVLPVWFVLATNQPVLYSVGLVAVGACAGYCFARIAGSAWEEGYMTITATQATAVAVSLLVVRSCGYRLVRLAPSVQK